ncbi:MAG: hypothetical protein LQ339_003592 [Xanthoria mediterranea]|nr:MAG: hypothetical protein LQ339_003592 [Xanthoria mediterranea]
MYLRVLSLFFIIASCLADSQFYNGLEFEESPINRGPESGDSPVNSNLESGETPVNGSINSGAENTSSDYVAFFCENLERSAGLPKLLAQVRQTIQLVIRDLQYGMVSRHGYLTFFKSNEHLLFVEEVFRNITAGRMLQGRQPAIVCLHPSGQAPAQGSAYSMICEPQAGHGLVRARGLRSQASLSLCPEFWKRPAFPNGTDDCPVMAGRRGFQRFAEEEDGSALTDTQFGILIRELVRMYNPLDKGPADGGVNGAQECSELNREQSIQNAGNWALYAACKFRPLVLFRCRYSIAVEWELI